MDGEFYEALDVKSGGSEGSEHYHPYRLKNKRSNQSKVRHIPYPQSALEIDRVATSNR